MAENRIICKCNNIDYITIRKAMVMGAREMHEIMEMTGAGTVCKSCSHIIEEILASVCGCNNVSLKTVVDAVNNGATTSSEVEKITGAGASCKKCKVLVDSIIRMKK